MTLKKIDPDDERFLRFEQTLFPAFDPYFEKYLNRFFFGSLFLLILFGILLFDFRISEGGDDSSYLLEAMKFSKGDSFPSFHGTFYVMLIGWIIRLTGFHPVFFKVLSLLFLITHQIFFYLAFRKRISPFLLSITLLIISINSAIIYFGSQTYTEAFFFMLQSIFFYLIFTRLIDLPNNTGHIKSAWRSYLGAGITLVLLSSARNIGIVALIALILFFLLDRKFLPAIYTLFSFLLVKIPYFLYKRFIWHITESDLHGQLSIMLLKDPYNSTLGKENISGLIVRFFENAGNYLSRMFLEEIGLQKEASGNTSIPIAVVVALILISGLVLAYRSRFKHLRFLFLYIFIALGISFISLNQFWSQARLIIVFIPIMILLMSWTIADMAKEERFAFAKSIVIILLALVFLSSVVHVSREVKINRKIQKRYLAGDKYAGYTADLKNYFAMSEWAAQNIPEQDKIGARKASMSFVYGKGREFYPIYKIPYDVTKAILDSASRSNATVFFINDLDIDKLKREFHQPLKNHLEAIIAFNNAVYSMYSFSTKQKADSIISRLNVSATEGVEAFKKRMAKELQNSSTVLVPDKLLNELKRNNVHYLIDASLRVNPLNKKGGRINTIKRYRIAINSKYPGAFTMVKQIGNSNDEPAWLFKVNYDRCKELGWNYKE